ncbi:MAG: deoxyguanosinetriphosphate triphosphohydrolase [Armatimonadota bacterium]|nr:deoxyguanosinetriphosphate triphosphohydrolase [Armatimonadota bacterium]MDR7404847.1 deoxyguanosinetriphosphate triphosphohydrolase [Armatimonadota bacterium]
MTVREAIEAREREWLAPGAALASRSRGRAAPEPEDDLRTCFQRDRDRLIHSKAFRRLKHKTQVFLAPEGDHYRTRLTHTLEVMQVARTAARALRLNEDLTEAIALAHDLGHPPFGHAGEEALNEVMAPVGGFRHDLQSLRVVDLLEVRVRSDGSPVRGLNLTWEVRDGIGGHSKGLADLPAAGPADAEGLPQTLEGQVVRLADRIAYVHHDTDDAIRAGLIAESDVPAAVRRVLGDHRGQWLGRMVSDLVAASAGAPVIRLSDPVREALNLLKDFLVERVYRGPATMAEVVKARRLVTALYGYYQDHPQELPAEYQDLISAGEPVGRVVGDFLAGMTDRYAIRLAETLFVPRGWAP